MAENLGAIFAMVSIYAGLPVLGVLYANHLNRKRDYGKSVRWPICLALGVDLLLLLGRCAADPAGQQAQPQSQPQSAPQAIGPATGDIDVQRVSFGPAGQWPATLDDAFAQRFNTGAKKGLIETLRKRDPSLDIETASVSTQVVSVAGHQLLRSTAEVPSRFFSHQFAGVVAGEVVLVICSSRIAQRFEAEGSVCGQKVAEVFGS